MKRNIEGKKLPSCYKEQQRDRVSVFDRIDVNLQAIS